MTGQDLEQKPEIRYRPIEQIYSIPEQKPLLPMHRPLPSEPMHRSPELTTNWVSTEQPQSQIERREFSDMFHHQLDGFQSTIPDEVTRYYMRINGLDNCDVTVVKLISLATQKFISDIILDAVELTKMSMTAAERRGTASRMVLTSDVLKEALKNHGIDYLAPPYHQ